MERGRFLSRKEQKVTVSTAPAGGATKPTQEQVDRTLKDFGSIAAIVWENIVDRNKKI